MDLLAPFLNQLPPSAHYYFSGLACDGGTYDGSGSHGYLHVVRSGQLTVSVGGQRTLTIERPTALLFPRPCPHTLQPGKQGAELVCGQIDFGFREQNPLAWAMPDFLALPLDDVPSVQTTLLLLYEEAFRDAVAKASAIDRLLEYFLIQVLRHLIDQGELRHGALAALADPRLAQALQAMHERPAHPWTLEQLADLSHMSRARFAARFHQLAGVPPLDYLTNWRLSVARGLLRRGRPIKSVASAVGYSSPVAFGRAFQRRLGLTPAEWLKSG